MRTDAQLHLLLTKLRLTLESTTPGLHIVESAITEDNFLLVTYIFRNKSEESVFLGPNEWPSLGLFNLAIKLIEKIYASLPTPDSTMSH